MYQTVSDKARESQRLLAAPLGWQCYTRLESEGRLRSARMRGAGQRMSMSTSDGEGLTRLSARTLAARIASGDVSAVEAGEARHARIEAGESRGDDPRRDRHPP